MNTKPNHSPTPWTIDTTIGVNGLPVWLIEDSDGDPIARVTHESDARAVVALPELIAALEFLDREVTALEMFGETGQTAGRANVEKAQLAAHAVIALCKGGTTP